VRFGKLLRLRSRFSVWECSWIFCAAECFNRTEVAFWLPRYANDRAKIEECGVEGPGVGFWKKTCRILPKLFPLRTGIDRFAKIEKPRQNASRVSFDDWNGSIKREAGHCVRSVFADARQSLHLFD
jgi:hypothetical protein